MKYTAVGQRWQAPVFPGKTYVVAVTCRLTAAWMPHVRPDDSCSELLADMPYHREIIRHANLAVPGLPSSATDMSITDAMLPY